MRFGIVHSEIKFPFASALTFRYLCEYEDRLRFGIVKSETGFPFASALTFHYLCEYEDRLRFGIVKSETGFPFVSALTFHYLCEYEDRIAVRHSQIGNEVSVCLCSHLSLSLWSRRLSTFI